jgi:hypothetical protein
MHRIGGLLFKTIYNFNFFGGWREGTTSFNGHYLAITDGTTFALHKTGDYGSFSYFHAADVYVQKMKDNDFRVAHDIIRREFGRFLDDLSDLSSVTDISEPMWHSIYTEQLQAVPLIWKAAIHYPIHPTLISKNIQLGDTVSNLFTGESHTLNSTDCNFPFFNRNFNYKITSRGDDSLHPEPMSLDQVRALYQAAAPPYAHVFGWEEVCPPKLKGVTFLKDDYIVDGSAVCTIRFYGDKDEFFIQTEDGRWFRTFSHTNLQDAESFVLGIVYKEGNVHYGLKKVVFIGTNGSLRSSISWQAPEEERSYRYNTAATNWNVPDKALVLASNSTECVS